VKAVRLPAMSPNLSAYAERFVLSIKSECLERIVPLGEDICDMPSPSTWRTTIARGTIKGWERFDRREQQDVAGAGRIVRRERLGGLLSFYHRKTAVRERTE